MSVNSQQVLEDLMRVLGDIDELVKSAATAGDGKSVEKDPALDCKLVAIRSKIDAVKEGLSREAHRRVAAVDGYFRDNTWKTVGTAAALAFIAGLIIGRPSRE